MRKAREGEWAKTGGTHGLRDGGETDEDEYERGTAQR
jgi:hypothetical protein